MLDCISIAHDIVVPAIISAPVPVSFSVVHAIFAAPAPFAARGSSVAPVFSVAPAISDDLAVAVALAVFADPRASAALKIVDAPAAFVLVLSLMLSLLQQFLLTTLLVIPLLLQFLLFVRRQRWYLLLRLLLHVERTTLIRWQRLIL